MRTLNPAVRALLWTAVLGLTSGSAWAQTTDIPIPDLTNLGTQLVALAVVALVVESALATIFQWRVYRMVFNNRAMKTLVMIAVALIVVLTFGYDVFARIVGLLTKTNPESGPISIGLSALVIAGGSAGVNTILQRLGIRSPIQDVPEQPVLNDKQAWFSVQVNRGSTAKTTGPVQISIRELPADPDAVPLAGTLTRHDFWTRLKMAFFANSMRFPNYGGRTVEVAKTYEISATATSRDLEADGIHYRPFTKVVYKGRFAPRAIVDFTVDM